VWWVQEINTSAFQAHHWVNLQREFLSVQLSHPHVICTHGYFFVPDKVYFVQEYAKGGNLYQALKHRGPFSESR
jgi:serine/threonine protein kinase